MRRNGRQVEDIADLSGLARTDRTLALVLGLLMFSLAGIPPLAGFFGKYFVFMAAIKANLVTLAVIGVVTSVVGAYYYLRIVKVMYFDEPAQAFEHPAPEVRAVIVLSGVFTLFFAIFAPPLVALAGAAAHALF
jgi:NADH-quinone oxidoreductase subunit N